MANPAPHQTKTRTTVASRETENDVLRERIREAAELADEWLHEARGERMVPVSALQAVRDALRLSPGPTSAEEADRG